MEEKRIDLSKYRNNYSRKHQLIRALWAVVWTLFARPLPRNIGSGWKRMLLRMFGARIHRTASVYSSAKVFYPANLVMEEYACLGPEVNCYNAALVKVGAHTTVSQGAYLCTATHDISDPLNHLYSLPIVIEDQAWIASEAFIGPGVTVKQGAVVGARAAEFKDVEPWTVAGGNPAKFIKKRELKDEK